jgi:putative transposase
MSRHKSYSQIFRASRQRYGSPRVRAELRAQGIHCAAKRVARLMRQSGLCARRARRRVRPTLADPTLAVAPHLLNRDFTANAPNQKWLADITYLPTHEGWSYLAVVLDLYSRRVAGWAMRPTLERDVVISALKQALQQRRPVHDLLHHSDRGSQYASWEYQHVLAEAGINCSMSRRGNCWDNAPMESFFSTLKSELGEQLSASRAAVQSALFKYIERFYNRHSRRYPQQDQRCPQCGAVRPAAVSRSGWEYWAACRQSAHTPPEPSLTGRCRAPSATLRTGCLSSDQSTQDCAADNTRLWVAQTDLAGQIRGPSRRHSPGQCTSTAWIWSCRPPVDTTQPGLY